MSSAEMATARLAYLRGLAQHWALGAPTVPGLVRYVANEEIGTWIPPCMKEQGFIVSANAANTGIEGDIPPGQERAMNLAEWTCQAKYTPNPRLMSANTHQSPGLLGLTWDYRSEFIIACLARVGHPATVGLPSRDAYIAQGGVWAGYPQIADPAEARRVNQACPAEPPSSLLLGG